MRGLKVGRDEGLEPIDADVVVGNRRHLMLGPLTDGGERIELKAAIARIFEQSRKDKLWHFHQKIDVFCEPGLGSVRGRQAAYECVRHLVAVHGGSGFR